MRLEFFQAWKRPQSGLARTLESNLFYILFIYWIVHMTFLMLNSGSSWRIIFGPSTYLESAQWNTEYSCTSEMDLG